MNTKNLFIITFPFIAINSVGQSNFRFSPEKPHAGEVITITYLPAGDLKNITVPPDAVIYKLGDNGQTANDLHLKKSGKLYTTSFTTDTTDNFVFFNFSLNEKYDDSMNNGYWIQLYNGDSIKKGSNISLSTYYQFYSVSSDLELRNTKALQCMDNEFALYPGSKKDNLIFYAKLYLERKKYDSIAFIEKQIEEQIKDGLNDEKDYTNLQNLYSLANLSLQSNLILDLKKAKFPEGKWSKAKFIQEYYDEKDALKKEQMLDDIISKVGSDSSWKYVKPTLHYLKSLVPTAYAEKNDWKGMKRTIKKYDIEGSELARLYNIAATQMLPANIITVEGEQMAKEAADLARTEWLKPDQTKLTYLTEKQRDALHAGTYASYANLYAMFMYQSGNFKRGFSYSKDAAIVIEKGKDSAFNNTYALLGEKILPRKFYLHQLEQFVKNDASTQVILAILRRSYFRKNISEKEFEDYIASFKKQDQ